MKKVLLGITVIAFSFISLAEDCKKDKIEGIVKKACELVNAGKMNDLISKDFNGPCDSYVWVNLFGGDNKMVFHPFNRKLVGNSMKGTKDPKGHKIFENFDAAAKDKGKAGYVQYEWPKPPAGKIETKCSYVMNCDGKNIAGMGIYAKCDSIGLTKADYIYDEVKK